jgi:hypothetical protein
MKIVEYKCNLCKQVVDKKDIMAYYYDSTLKNNNGFGRYKLTTLVDNCDAHICNTCIGIIKKSKL